MAKHRMTVQEAAEELGITVDAVRQRLRRGKLERAEPPEDDDKRVYVWLDDDQTEDQTVSRHEVQVEDALVSAYERQLEGMEDQIDYLRRIIETRDMELQRKDSIIAAITQRIPELEPAREEQSEPRESAVSDSEDTAKVQVPKDSAEAETRQPWWKRWFRGAPSE
jgi:predicted transcriptional regulator